MVDSAEGVTLRGQMARRNATRAMNRGESTATTSRDSQARHVAAYMWRSIATLQAVCLFGSVARGDDTPFSDIDLLVVGSDRTIMPTTLLKTVPRSQRGRVSVVYLTAAELRRQFDNGSLFIEHIRREGTVLYDKNGVLRDLINKPFRLKPKLLDAEIARELSALRPYEKLERFQGNFVFCLSHLYAIGKNVVMLRLAQGGHPEFDRERAFQRFLQIHPQSRREVDAIRRLRPFYLLVTRRVRERLPFPYRNAEAQMLESMRAIRSLAAIGSKP